MPLSGGEEVKVLDQPPGWAWFNWVLTPGGIYFLDLMAPPNGRIEFFDVATRRTAPIFSLQDAAPGYAGVAISPDRKAILYGQTDLADSYIMFGEKFSIEVKLGIQAPFSQVLPCLSMERRSGGQSQDGARVSAASRGRKDRRFRQLGRTPGEVPRDCNAALLILSLPKTSARIADSRSSIVAGKISI
jgi:hypothetical protein